jgi:N-acetylneuraminic acid mutarotase
MLSERSLAAAAAWNGKVVATGGYKAKGVPLNSAEQYDPETNKWIAISSLLTARCVHALVNADNALFAIGGWDDEANVSSVERYDAESSAWQLAPEPL